MNTVDEKKGHDLDGVHARSLSRDKRLIAFRHRLIMVNDYRMSLSPRSSAQSVVGESTNGKKRWEDGDMLNVLVCASIYGVVCLPLQSPLSASWSYSDENANDLYLGHRPLLFCPSFPLPRRPGRISSGARPPPLSYVGGKKRRKKEKRGSCVHLHERRTGKRSL